MLIEMPYGSKKLSLDLPGGQVKRVLEARPLPCTSPERALVEEALSNPVGSAPLAEIVSRGERVCIVIGDMTRLWVRHDVLLPPLLAELNRGGVSDEDIFIICATGDHREQTESEQALLAGAEVCRRVEVINHRAGVESELVSLGRTSRGTPVRINRRVAEADRVILTGGIVYHFLAGWGGGKKAILPGVAAYETIMKNHSLAFNPGRGLNPDVRSGKLDGNPCSEDMEEGTALVAPAFILNSIIDEGRDRIAYAVAGEYRAAFRRGCALVSRHFGVALPGRTELVIASCGGYPKDIDFYQAYKTIYNAHFALKRGGTLILLAECREGIGSEQFARVFSDYRDNRQREDALRSSYTIGGHMGYHSAVIAEENDVLVISELADEQVRGMGMIPVKTLSEGLEFVKGKHRAVPPAYIMPHGGSTLPCPGG